MPEQYPLAYAVGTDPRELVNICLSQVGDINADVYLLGFLYVSDALADELDHIVHLLVHGSGVEDWVGSLGIALCVTNQEIYDQPAMAVLFTPISRSDYQLLPTIHEVSHVEGGVPQFSGGAQGFAVIHGDSTNPETPEIISALAQVSSDSECFFTGGLTSSQKNQYQVVNTVEEGGVSGVLFSDKVNIITGHTQGCTPLQGQYTITSCRQNIIQTLDNKPAVNVMKDCVGEVLARDLSRLGGFIFAGLPVEGSDTHDYMVRNLIGLDESSGVIAIGEMVNEGDPFIFCRRDGNTAVVDMQSMLERIKTQLKGQPPLGGLYFSCLGRGRYQFGENSEEMKMISQVLGDFPVIGFQANGEIFHGRLYGYTGVLVVFT